MSDAVSQPFVSSFESVGWANDAIAEIHAEATAFFQSDIQAIITEVDLNTGEHVQKIRLTKPLPKAIRRKATEALNNARHAFDRATFAARNLTSGPSMKSIYYPWSKNPADLNHILKSRSIDQRLWDTFKAHEPYPRGDTYAGGNNVIRTLAAMANDKHTVGLTIGAQITKTIYPAIIGHTMHSIKIMNPRWDSVKNEAELARWIGGVEVNGDYRFAFQVLFKDARLTEPVDVVRGLRAFTAKAQAVAESLQTRCAELSL